MQIGFQKLIELISQRKTIEFKNKLSKAIQKFYKKFGYYPSYIENNYCEKLIEFKIKYYLKNCTLTNLNQAHYHISKTFDDLIKEETNLNNMIDYDNHYDLCFN